MSDNITSNLRSAAKEFKKIGNPHLKKRQDSRSMVEDRPKDKEVLVYTYFY
jgi:hypothetical protein